MKAFAQKDYNKAILYLKEVPKAATKKRGVQEREEYVKANFYRGLSLQKTGHLKEAVSAYQNALSVEKYFPVCEVNLGICYLDLRQYAKAHRALQHVIRDQNRIPPAQYDEVIQSARYFWALTWTRMYQYAKETEKKEHFRQEATLKWTDYRAWFGDNSNFEKANRLAENYINSLKARQ
jgi:tetratricopeptide (TPR) repeat protein